MEGRSDALTGISSLRADIPSRLQDLGSRCVPFYIPCHCRGDLRPPVAHPLPLPWGPLQDGRLEAEASVFMFKRTL